MCKAKRLILLFILFIFLVPNVFAKEKNVEIINVELDSKSENVVVVNDVTYENMSVKSNVNFYNVGDYVKYKVTIKNNDSVNYIIDSITDNNTHPEIKYEYEYDKDLDKNSEKTIILKIEYTSVLPVDASLNPNNVYSSESEVKISLNLSENTFNILNPSTYDQVSFYILIEFIFLIILLVTFIALKVKNKNKIIVFLLLFMIPYVTKAEGDFKFTFTLSNEIDVKISFLDKEWKTKVSGNYTKIKFVRNNKIHETAVDVSEETDGSIKAWVENDIVYIGSNYKIYFPIDSGELLSKNDVTSIEFDNIDTFFTEKMNKMFYNDSEISNIDVSKFDTHNSTDLSYMFSGMTELKSIDVSNFDTSKVTTMSNMFSGTSKIKKLNLSTFNTPNVENFSEMFSNMTDLEDLIMDNWDLTNTSNTSINNMYKNSGNIKTISVKKWKLPKYPDYVLACSGGAYLCSTNLQSIDVSGWDFSETQYSYYGFSGSKTREIKGLDTWDTSNIRGVYYMFANCTNIEELNLDNWNFSNMYANGTLSGMTSLKKLSAKNWIIPKTFDYRFNSHFNTSASPLEEIDVSGWDLSQTKDISGLFSSMRFLKKIKGLDTWDTSNIENMHDLFYKLINIEEIDVSHFDTSNVTNMGTMFYMNRKITHLDLSNFNTSKVTNIANMFAYCDNLRSLDLSSFDTSSVTNMYSVFQSDFTLKELDISNFTINSSTSFSSMLNGTPGLVSIKTPKTVLIGNSSYPDFDKKMYDEEGNEYTQIPRNVTNHSITLKAKKEANLKEGSTFNGDMGTLSGSPNNIKHFKRSKTLPVLDFYKQKINLDYVSRAWFNVATIDGSGYPVYIWYDSSDGTIYYYCELETAFVNSYATQMFGYLYNIEDIDVSGLDTSKVEHFAQFFKEDRKVKKLDLSNFDTSSGTDMYEMFKNMTSLEEINVTSFNTSKVRDMADIFTSLTSLEELDLSSFDLSKISSSYTDFLRNLTSLKRLKTPKVMPTSSITLSGTYVDENGNEYTALDQNTPTKTWLTKKQ